MKYTEDQARGVISLFQKELPQRISVIDYHVEEFFHVFKIAPIQIDGTIRNTIRFKDSLVQECISSPYFIPNIREMIKVCFG